MIIGLKRIGIEVDPSTWFPGGGEQDFECRIIRQLLGLPLTKQLVYYHNKHDAGSMALVTDFRIAEVYQKSDIWFDVEILVHTPGNQCGQKIHIHSAYLVEMQDRNFIKNMAKMEAEGG